MAPIVDGLKTEYDDRVDFRSLKATEGQGLAAFQAYHLLGHPAYVILQPDGSVAWRFEGQTSREVLEQNIQSALTR